VPTANAFAFVFRPLGLQQQASVEADGDEAACVAELPGTQPLDAFPEPLAVPALEVVAGADQPP
jgi:hypothetical protein